MAPKLVCKALAAFLLISLVSAALAEETGGKQFDRTISANEKKAFYLADVFPGWYGSAEGDDIRAMTPTQLLRRWKAKSFEVRGHTYSHSVSFASGLGHEGGVGFHIEGYDFFDATVTGNWNVPIMGAARVIYLVYGDKKLLYTSPPMESGHDPLKIHVPVTGIFRFWIETRASDVITPSSIWWCDARLSKDTSTTRRSAPGGESAIGSKSDSADRSSLLDVAATIGGLSLHELHQLDALIHKRIQTLETSHK